jgi:Glycosyltransferases involved in cell wall biogenesis
MLNSIILSLIIPAQNDEMSLSLLVQEALAILPHHVQDFEIIIVDSSSNEQPMQLAARLAVQHDPVVVVKPRQLGYGNALRYAFAAARGDTILVVDANRQISLSDIARALPFIEQSELVLGYRWPKPKAANPSRNELLRRVGAWLCAVSLRDPECGFKLFKSSALRSLDLQTSGSLIDIEIVAKAELQGLHVHEVAVSYDPAIRVAERPVSWNDLKELLQTISSYRLRQGLLKRRWDQPALLGGLVAMLVACWYAIRRRQ